MWWNPTLSSQVTKNGKALLVQCWGKRGSWNKQQRWPGIGQIQSSSVPGVWISRDWDGMQHQNPWAVAKCLMSFHRIREDHAGTMPASGNRSKGKGKWSRLCLFLAPGPLLGGSCHRSYHRAEAERHCPSKCAISSAVPGGYWMSFSSKILSAKQRVTNVSSFIVVVCYIWFILFV